MRLAYRFAMENDLVRADAIESTEFPELVGRYRIYAVPKTVINQAAFVEGSLPEEMFLNQILVALEPGGAGAPDS